jgi:hypothetical protein
MGFPYLAPLKDWVKNVLEDREASYSVGSNTNITNNHLKMPWATLTSAAKVVQSTSLKELDADARKIEFQNIIKENSTKSSDYFGCIIRNNINSAELSYQQSETIVGIDFKGDPIKVIGEKNRRVSTPIIESIDIDTDGANNTLKSAKLTIRCFSLKQFEMFELFFCKPGMNVLVEYGDNTLDIYRGTKKATDVVKGAYSNSAYVSGQLFDKTNYTSFIENFSNYYRFNNTSLKVFQQHVEKSLGSYDMVAGKVTDYSFSIEENGTYVVNLEVSQGNQMSLAIPVNTGNTKSTIGSPATNDTPFWKQCINQMAADLDIEISKLIVSKEEVDKEFFNWGKVNDDKKDEVASSESYVTLRFVLEKLMNYSLNMQGAYDVDTFRFDIPLYDVDGSMKEYIPIRSHKNIISTNTDIIFPNKEMVKFRAPIKGSKEQDTIQIAKETIDGSINGYSLNEGKVIKNSDGSITNPTLSDGNTNGNALNIFINYKIIVQAWKASYTRKDFLASILNSINGASLGKFRLTINSYEEGKTATVMDWTSTSDVIIDEKNIYKFKVNSLESNVRNFSFNFEMSNLVAGRTVFNAQQFLIKALKEPKGAVTPDGIIPLPPAIYQEFDNSLMSNADGFFSINMIDLKALEKNYNSAIKTETVPEDDKKETPNNEVKDYTDIIDKKSIKFKKSKSDIKPLIFTDKDLIKKYISAPVSDAKSTLSPIEVTVGIDGLNGINCGEYFRINGIPEIYNQIGVFQVTNVKHNISADGWLTTLEAQHRITPKN